MISTREAASDGHSVWVGALDLGDGTPVSGLNGPARPGHSAARVLVRLHGAAVGYVHLPATPGESLARRAQAAAEVSLADALRQHLTWDAAACQPGGTPDWAARTACPLRFPAASGMGVTVVVCSRDRSEALRGCLRAMRRVSYAPLEILVVDNAPGTDATREVVAEMTRGDPRIRYACEPRPGLSHARNYGLRHASHDIVAFTDDDTLVDPGWPTALAAGFAADAEALCLTGLVVSSALDTNSERYFDARYGASTVFEPRRYDLGCRPTRLYPYSAGIFGTGANFAVRRDAIAGLGGFDPLLGVGSEGRGGEDLDIFLRVILAGGSICYLPAALVWHRNRTDVQALRQQLYSYGHGLGAYLAKHLANRDLRAALLGHGLHEAGAVLGQMRHAAQASQVRSAGASLGLIEVLGMLAGALRYRRAARRASRSPSGSA